MKVGRCCHWGSPSERGACLPPLYPPDSLTGGSGGTLGCHQGAINASAAAAASGWCWVLSRVLWPTQYPRTHAFSSAFCGRGNRPRQPARDHPASGGQEGAQHCPLCGPGCHLRLLLCTPCAWCGYQCSLRMSQKILTLPRDRIFLLGILLETASSNSSVSDISLIWG